MKNWHKKLTWQHWIRHSFFPIITLALLLLLPKAWLINATPQSDKQGISIELSKLITKKQTPKTITTIETREDTNTIEKLEKTQKITPIASIKKPQNQIEAAPISTQVNSKINPKVQQKTNLIKLSASDVQIMLSKAIDPKITDSDFTAKTQNQFISKQYEVSKLFTNTPFLDENVDAPRVHMNFYSKGYTGSIERFFDKITYEKTFTTKYGTKINCAVVAVLAMCGWK